MRTAGRYTEVALGDKLQSQALSYIGDHPLAPLAVGFHNTLRMFELEGSYAWHASALAIGLHGGGRPDRRGRVLGRLLLALLGLLTRPPAGRRGGCGRSRCSTRSRSCSSTSRRPASASRSTRS